MVAAGLLVALGLNACGDGGGGGGSKTLVILAHVNAPTVDAFNKLSRDFEKQNPGVKVRVDSVPTEQYLNVRNSRVAAGAADIVENWGLSQALPDYVKGVAEDPFILGAQAGNYEDLTDQPFLDRFVASARQANEIDGKIYAVPSGSSIVTGIFYNKSIFAKYNLQPPKTWTEFEAVCRTLQSNDVTPLLIGGKEIWPAGLPLFALLQGMFPDLPGLDKQLWTDPDVLTDARTMEVLDKLKTIYGFAQKNFPGVSYEAIPAQFAKGAAAMTPDGSWSAPRIDAAKPDFEYGYVPLPGTDSPEQNKFGYKSEFVMAVPSNAKNKDLAVKWLDFYSQPENYATFITTGGLMPLQDNVTPTAFLTELAPEVKRATPYWESYFHWNDKAGEYRPFYFQGLAPMGKYKTTDELARKIYDDWTAGLKAVGAR